jgi:hypothetical protein
MSDTSSIDVLLATLNATELGSLEAIAEKMRLPAEQDRPPALGFEHR